MIKKYTVLVAVCAMLFGAIAGAQDKVEVQSTTALPILVDFEKTAGWMLYLEGGYRWNFFRDAGIKMQNNAGATLYKTKNNYTTNGIAGAIAVGYNFCPKSPLTLGLKIGAGPQNRLEQRSWDNSIYHKEKVGLYSFDFALDYDMKNKSKFTPFVGINFGMVFTSHKVNARYSDGNDTYTGYLDKHRRINFIGGGRTGIKYDLNPRVALTLFGQYSYLGKIGGRDFDMYNSTGGSIKAKTYKMKAHSVESGLGIRIAF